MYYKLIMNMEKINKKPKRTFIPQSIGDTVKKINRNYVSKFGKIEFIIHSNWAKIVGSYFADFSQPKNVSQVYDSENDIGEHIYKRYLNVSVAPAAALEFQFFKNTVIEKINSYFGYKAIIDLKIQQNFTSLNTIKTRKKLEYNVTNNVDKKYIKNEVEEVKNHDLKKSLFDLGVNMSKGIK